MTEVRQRKKLIEVALPLEAINVASAREKSIRHGHPSTLHLWWARRPLAAARAVIFSQMVDDPSEYVDVLRSDKGLLRKAHADQMSGEAPEPGLEPTLDAILAELERERLFDIIKDLVLWENTTNEAVLKKAREEIWQSWRRSCAENAGHPQAKELFNRDVLPAFHDPFAGGGALPLEAQRLGLEAHASDLNPVAVLINKAMIEIPPKFAGRPPVNPEARSEWRGESSEHALSGTDRVAEGDGIGAGGVSVGPETAQGGDLRDALPDNAGGRIDSREHRRGVDTGVGQGESPIPGDSPGVAGGSRNASDAVRANRVVSSTRDLPPQGAVGRGKPDTHDPSTKAQKNVTAALLAAHSSQLFPRNWTGAQGLAEDVRYYGQWMRDEAEKRIGHLYPKAEITKEMVAERPDLKQYEGKKLTVIAWLWARTVKSPNPAFADVDVPLASTFMLSTKKGKEAYVEPVIEAGGYRFKVKMGKPKDAEAAKKGTKMARANFGCLMSETPVSGDYIKAEGKAGRMGARLMAIVAKGDRGRVYLAPLEEHEAAAGAAKPEWRPEGDIAKRMTGGNCTPYGLTTWGDLFTPRQLVALTTFSDLVQEARDKVRADAEAAWGASSAANHPSSVTNKASSVVNQAASVANQAASSEDEASSTVNHPSSATNAASSASNQPSSMANEASSGTNEASNEASQAQNTTNKAKNAANPGQSPLDSLPLDQGGTGPAAYADAVAVYLGVGVNRLSDRCSTICGWDSGFTKIRNTFGRQAIPMTWDYAEGNVFSDSTGNFSSLLEWVVKFLRLVPATLESNVLQGDASAQLVSENKIVSTDPPYYDNIGYADLSDFFYVWLRRSLRPVFPDLFATLAVPKAEELVATPYRHGGRQEAEAFFLVGMCKALWRLAEQTHPAFAVTIYYAFKQSETKDAAGTTSTGWVTFLDAVIDAGFGITGTWPMRTELSNRMIGSGTNALASSIVLVCRKRAADAPTATRREFATALKAELPVALAHLQKGNIAPVDLAQAAIGPGMGVFTRYEKVLDAEGKRVGVREALALINETLDEALAEQEGDFDAESRWALAWFDQSGFEEGEYGVAETLSTAKNTSVSGMMDAGILVSKGGKVRLLKPSELPADWDPETDPRLTTWEMVHHLIRVLAAGGESAAAVLAAKLGAKAETARELCYRLYTVCERKKRAAEAMAYNGLVQSWPEIIRLAGEAQTASPGETGDLFEEHGTTE